MSRRLAFASVLFAPLAAVAQQQDASRVAHPRRGEAATAAVAARRDRIAAELAGPGDRAAWAGRYYRGDGLGVQVQLELAPEAGFAWCWSGCAGTIDQDHGRCVERDGHVVLVSAFPAAPERGALFAAELVPVRWGARRYLVPSAELIAFVNAVNGGGEPRDGPHGSFLLRRGDERRPAAGRPELPERVAAWLLDEPVRGAIAAVHARWTEGRPPLRYEVTEATIDRGRDHGLMEGHVVRFRGYGFGVGRVVELAGGSARVRIRVLALEGAPAPPPEPAVGWRWSTRARDRR